MTPYLTPTINDAFREFAELQLRHHYLLRDGKGESPEAEQIEDQLSAQWERLDGAQQKELNGMGSDLNWLRRRGEPPPQGRPKSESKNSDLEALDAAQKAHDWLATLYHLRNCAAALPKDVVAYSRAMCYHKLNFPQMAEDFADLAIEVSGDDSPVAALAMEALTRVTPGRAFQRAAAVMAQPAIYPPVIVVQCLAYLITARGGRVKQLGVDNLVGVVRNAWERMESAPPDKRTQAIFYQLAGDEMRIFRRNDDARALYEKGMRLAPDHPEILSGLALLLYEKDQKRSVELFQQAIRLKPMHYRPYLHLAHYHLVRGEHALAFSKAQDALSLASDNGAKAAALDIMAISASEMGVDDELVLGMFTRAVEYAGHAPWRDRIANNMNVFLAKLAGKPTRQSMDLGFDEWESESKETTFRKQFDVPVFAT